MNRYSDIDILNHEVRTPLAGLLGMIGQLGSTSFNTDQKRCLQEIQLASQKLIHAMESLLQEKQPLPLKKAERVDASIEETTRPAKKKALLIEDSFLVQQAQKRMLEGLGYVVHAASTGKEGLALYALEDYDLAVMDVGLPDMSGIEILQKMQAYPRNPHMKKVVVTAFVSDAVIQSCKAQGCGAVLNKPLSTVQLQSALDTRISA